MSAANFSLEHEPMRRCECDHCKLKNSFFEKYPDCKQTLGIGSFKCGTENITVHCLSGRNAVAIDNPKEYYVFNDFPNFDAHSAFGAKEEGMFAEDLANDFKNAILSRKTIKYQFESIFTARVISLCTNHMKSVKDIDSTKYSTDVCAPGEKCDKASFPTIDSVNIFIKEGGILLCADHMTHYESNNNGEYSSCVCDYSKCAKNVKKDRNKNRYPTIASIGPKKISFCANHMIHASKKEAQKYKEYKCNVADCCSKLYPTSDALEKYITSNCSAWIQGDWCVDMDVLLKVMPFMLIIESERENLKFWGEQPNYEFYYSYYNDLVSNANNATKIKKIYIDFFSRQDIVNLLNPSTELADIENGQQRLDEISRLCYDFYRIVQDKGIRSDVISFDGSIFDAVKKLTSKVPLYERRLLEGIRDFTAANDVNVEELLMPYTWCAEDTFVEFLSAYKKKKKEVTIENVKFSAYSAMSKKPIPMCKACKFHFGRMIEFVINGSNNDNST